jgi:hypothetical protein
MILSGSAEHSVSEKKEPPMTMTSYERVMAAFHRREPDRVPIFELMIDPKIINGILPGGTYADLIEALDIDCVLTPTASRMYSLELVDRDGDTPIYRTEWGELRAGTGVPDS